MPIQMTDNPVPLSEYAPAADQFVIFRLQNFGEYEALLELRGERSRPRLSYLDGVVQLMSPSSSHDRISRVIMVLVYEYCAAKDVSVNAVGSWTQKDEVQEAGLEPDECFVFGPMAGRTCADLAVEVVWTHGGIEKLEIYQRLGVREVWFWKNHAITVHVLGTNGYEIAPRSERLPDLDLSIISELLPLDDLTAVSKLIRARLAR